MSEISVVVVGSTSISSVVGNGDTVNVTFNDGSAGGGGGEAATIQVGSVTTLSPTQSASVVNVGTAYAAKLDFGIPRGQTGSTGPVGPSVSLKIGTVTSGTSASASIAGTGATQTLSLVLPQGPAGVAGPSGPAGATGPANSLSVGSVSVTTAATAAVTITGNAPSQQISFVVPRGPQGDQGPAPTIKVGTVTTGSPAAVSAVASGSTVTLNFTIPGGSGGGADLADETPQPLGTASAGTALKAARADHVHPVPTISYASLTNVPATFPPAAHTQDIETIVGLQAALDALQPAGTYATLVGGTVPSSQLPSYVDDVLEYASLAGFPAGFPAAGEVGKIYVARDTNKTYRWSGSAYIEISPSPGSTDAVPEGATNLYFTSNRAADAAPVQSVAGRTGTITLTSADVSGVVSGVNGITGKVTLEAGSNVSLATNGSTITISSAAAPVESVAGRTGTITLTSADVGLGNVPNVDATKRANHTGTQAISTVDGLQAALDARLGLTATIDGGVYAGRSVLGNTLTFTTQPANQTATFRSATFTAAATTSAGGLAISYQWQRSDDGGSTWSNVIGATSPTLTVSQLTFADDHNDKYRVVASSLNTSCVPSNAATLTIQTSGWQQFGQTIEASASKTGFGTAVSIGGTGAGTVVAVGESGASNENGRAYVYAWNGIAWAQRGSVFSGAGGERLGEDVAVSRDGSFVAISSFLGVGGVSGVGGVRVFQWTGTTWSQRGAGFGSNANAVDISDNGEVVVLGSPLYDSGGLTWRGRVQVFQWNGTSWSQRGDDIVGGSAYDTLGDSVSVSAAGGVIAFSASQWFAQPAGTLGGYARVCKWSGSSWASVGEIGGDGVNSVALSANGGVLAAKDSRGGTQSRGLIKFYDIEPQPGSGLVQKSGVINESQSIQLRGDHISMNDDGTALAVEATATTSSVPLVQVFEKAASSWAARGSPFSQGAISLTNTAPILGSRKHVGISGDGNMLVVGIPQGETESEDPGLVRVYGFAG